MEKTEMAKSIETTSQKAQYDDRVKCLFIAIAGVLGVVWLLYLFFKPVPGKVREVNLSPTGEYQIDIIDWSGGATAGNSFLIVEKANSKRGFSEEGDDEPKRGFRLKQETWSAYGMSYMIRWDTEDRFQVYWGRNDGIDFAKVDMSDETAQRGRLKIKDGSCFEDYEIVDDKVLFSCRLYMENSFDEAVAYSVTAYADADQASGLLADSYMVAINEDGEKEQFVIDANTSAYIDVTFCGKRGTSDSRTNQKLPDDIRLELEGFASR